MANMQEQEDQSDVLEEVTDVTNEIRNNIETMQMILQTYDIIISQSEGGDPEDETEQTMVVLSMVGQIQSFSDDRKIEMCKTLEDKPEFQCTRTWLKTSIATETEPVEPPKIEEPVVQETVVAPPKPPSRSDSQATDILESQPRPYADVIQESAGTMVDCLIPCVDLLRHLEANSVLSADMVNKVLCRPNRPDKVRVLLKFMTRLGPQSVESFVLALNATEQYYLANILAKNIVI